MTPGQEIAYAVIGAWIAFVLTYAYLHDHKESRR